MTKKGGKANDRRVAPVVVAPKAHVDEALGPGKGRKRANDFEALGEGKAPLLRDVADGEAGAPYPQLGDAELLIALGEGRRGQGGRDGFGFSRDHDVGHSLQVSDTPRQR